MPRRLRALAVAAFFIVGTPVTALGVAPNGVAGGMSGAVPGGVAGGVPGATSGASDHARARTLFTFADPEIDESSGLADGGRVLFTVNDSGDGPRFFAVDKATGATVATTTYSNDSVIDVEAIAPGRDGDLWVGDTGDNRAARSSVAIYRVRAAGGRFGARAESTRYDLGYPDSAHDAETLLVQPRTGRVFVVSKALFGGTVFRAPRTLRTGQLNRLSAVAKAPGIVTDGSFFPDGRHVILRDYGRASVYTFPGWQLVGRFSLPQQEQGEGIAVGAGGAISISSEGVHSAVQRVHLPSQLAGAIKSGTRGTGGSADAGTATRSEDSASVLSHPGGVWLTAGILFAGAGWLTVRGARRRSRRMR